MNQLHNVASVLAQLPVHHFFAASQSASRQPLRTSVAIPAVQFHFSPISAPAPTPIFSALIDEAADALEELKRAEVVVAQTMAVKMPSTLEAFAKAPVYPVSKAPELDKFLARLLCRGEGAHVFDHVRRVPLAAITEAREATGAIINRLRRVDFVAIYPDAKFPLNKTFASIHLVLARLEELAVAQGAPTIHMPSGAINTKRTAAFMEYLVGGGGVDATPSIRGARIRELLLHTANPHHAYSAIFGGKATVDKIARVLSIADVAGTVAARDDVPTPERRRRQQANLKTLDKVQEILRNLGIPLPTDPQPQAAEAEEEAEEVVYVATSLGEPEEVDSIISHRFRDDTDDGAPEFFVHWKDRVEQWVPIDRLIGPDEDNTDIYVTQALEDYIRDGFYGPTRLGKYVANYTAELEAEFHAKHPRHSPKK